MFFSFDVLTTKDQFLLNYTYYYYINITYMAKYLKEKTFAVREEMVIHGKTFAVACLYTYIANQYGHRFIGKHLSQREQM